MTSSHLFITEPPTLLLIQKWTFHINISTLAFTEAKKSAQSAEVSKKNSRSGENKWPLLLYHFCAQMLQLACRNVFVDRHSSPAVPNKWQLPLTVCNIDQVNIEVW